MLSIESLNERTPTCGRCGERFRVFLPTMDDFESHVACHKEFLEEALKRNAGVVSLSNF